MGNANHVEAIARLSESEGVFTTAQAARMGIPRDALHDAVASGRIERIMHGAYRMIGSGSSFADELTAIWKLTAPARFTHERLRVAEWDGITVGGSTASALLEIGDLHVSPYRLYAPRRVNTRNTAVRFAKRAVPRSDVTFVQGLPVTRPERTVFDLVVDDEDFSLVADVLRDAWQADRGFGFKKLRELLGGRYEKERAENLYRSLLADSGLADEEETL
ncbi:type IV toxin-antitoxin system AbiEi family antitoxin domain-containing protein [uncultured Tessaracoccus sp.]|uniref:type IV toxin-antitoxin system AbiEi family antitoxin domain-containing protein n=1 Tax=uncultured Tessaracoccus sp. TaxID=905023 RepID=UPI00260DD0E8|nr:type IV toxin-antitoxin system AbiEi family antitoxin domain-containing protein [uncultured Tessaracoccus sp.]